MFGFIIKYLRKDAQDLTDCRVRERYGNFASSVGICSNLLLFLLKITAGLLSGSIAIVADAINNLSDSGSAVVTFFGFKLSGKPADAQHPFGHARMEYISGLIVSFIVLFLGLQLIGSSFKKIIAPQSANFGLLAMAILVVSILVKLWQCKLYRKIGKLIDSTALLATSLDSRNDIVATAAVLLAAIVTIMTGVNLDGYMGMIVAVFILISGVKLVQDTISPLLGTAPAKDLVDEIYVKILSYDHINGLHDLAIHSYGAGKRFATVHCEVSSDLDVMIAHDIIDNIERDFLEHKDIHLVIHYDPITTDEKTEELKNQVGLLISSVAPEIGMHDFRVVRGVSHSNLIFDVVVPFGFRYSDERLTELIAEKIHQFNPTYHAVVRVDHDYVPQQREDPDKKEARE